MGLKKLVQLKDDRKKKMVNDSYQFEFAVCNFEVVAPTIDLAHLKSPKVEICLSENPFLLFGKFFNLRVKDWEGLASFEVVMSRSERFEVIKRNVLATFLDSYPQFRTIDHQGMKPAVDMESLISRTKRVLRKGSTHENYKQSSTVSVAPVDDIKTESICLMLKAGSNDFARKLKNTALKTTIFDLKGPFGHGFGITRFCFGGQVFCGNDSGCFSFVDFADYLCRYYIYRYVQSKTPQDKVKLNQLDPFSDDFEFTFNNEPTFYFIFDFETKAEFEALMKKDLHLIARLEQELKLGLIGGISIRLQKAELKYGEDLEGISFSKVAKTTSKTLPDRLKELGFKDKGELLDQKVERVIVAGPREYLRDIREGFLAMGVNKSKVKSL